MLCCDWKEHRSIIKKLANRISYQTWYKGCLKGKFGRRVQIWERGVHIRQRIWTGGAKSAGVQIRCDTVSDEGEREVRITVQSEGGDWVFLFLAVWASFSSLFGFCAKKNTVFQFCCSFWFADYTRFSFWFSVFVNNTNGFSKFFPVYLRSEWQLSPSTDLEQPRNANVIESNAWKTKCH